MSDHKPEFHKIRIIPKLLNSSMLFTCQYDDPTTGEKITLLDKGKFGIVKIGQLDPGDRVKQIPMNVRSFIEFEYDKKDVSAQNTKNFVKFWNNNPFVQKKGSLVNSANSYLILEDLTETKSARVVSIKDIRKATQKFESFGSEENLRGWKNLAYYFGVVNADQLNYDDLYILLIDPKEDGLLLRPENIGRFLAYNSNDFKTQLAINTSRAIEKGFIEKRSVAGSGDTFFINNSPIGTSESDVIIYLEGKEDFYFNYVVEKLGDDAEIEKKVKAEETNKQIETLDLEGLRAQAKEKFLKLKELGVKGAIVSRWAQITTVEKMQAALVEADGLIKENTPDQTEGAKTIETDDKKSAAAVQS